MAYGIYGKTDVLGFIYLGCILPPHRIRCSLASQNLNGALTRCTAATRTTATRTTATGEGTRDTDTEIFQHTEGQKPKSYQTKHKHTNTRRTQQNTSQP